MTLDLDSTDSEVYGRRKQGAAFNHRGQRCYDSQLATWAERRRILAVELRPGNLNEHPTAIKLLRRALKALPAEHGRVRALIVQGRPLVVQVLVLASQLCNETRIWVLLAFFARDLTPLLVALRQGIRALLTEIVKPGQPARPTAGAIAAFP